MAWCEAMRRALIALLALSAFPASAAAVTNADSAGRADANFDVRSVATVPPDNAGGRRAPPRPARRRRDGVGRRQDRRASARWAG